MGLGELDYPLAALISTDHVSQQLERDVLHGLVDEGGVGHRKSSLKQSQYVIKGVELVGGRTEYGIVDRNHRLAQRVDDLITEIALL